MVKLGHNVVGTYLAHSILSLGHIVVGTYYR